MMKLVSPGQIALRFDAIYCYLVLAQSDLLNTNPFSWFGETLELSSFYLSGYGKKENSNDGNMNCHQL